MGNYNFRQDLKEAKVTEADIARFLTSRGHTILDTNNTADYDLTFRHGKNHQVFTIEIKEDKMCRITGNVAVELECRGKPSGLYTSKADYWFYVIHNRAGEKELWEVCPNKLRKVVAAGLGQRVIGGDSGSTTRMVLFDYTFFTVGLCIKQYKMFQKVLDN